MGKTESRRCCNSISGLNHSRQFLLSNADVSLVRENFTNPKYNTLSILCKRSINSKNPEAKAKEVIIKNYEFINIWVGHIFELLFFMVKIKKRLVFFHKK